MTYLTYWHHKAAGHHLLTSWYNFLSLKKQSKLLQIISVYNICIFASCMFLFQVYQCEPRQRRISKVFQILILKHLLHWQRYWLMFTILLCKNGNLPVIGILIACLAELVDKYISMISKHSLQHLFPGKTLQQTNVNVWWAGPATECRAEWNSDLSTDINLTLAGYCNAVNLNILN